MAVELYRANFQVAESSSASHYGTGPVIYRIRRQCVAGKMSSEYLKADLYNIDSLQEECMMFLLAKSASLKEYMQPMLSALKLELSRNAVIYGAPFVHR